MEYNVQYDEHQEMTNDQIAGDLNLWNEYFNTSAVMTDEEFHAMSYEERLEMLIQAFGAD